MTENCRAVKVTSVLDNNANQQSLLVLIGDVDSSDQSDLLPVRQLPSQGDARHRPPSESEYIENARLTATRLGGETASMASPSPSASPTSSSSSSSAAAAPSDVTDCKDEAAVTPTDDVYKFASDDVIRMQNNHIHHQPMTDKV